MTTDARALTFMNNKGGVGKTTLDGLVDQVDSLRVAALGV